MARIRIVNPGPKKRRRRKNAKKAGEKMARNRKGQFTKGHGRRRRRRRRSNPAEVVTNPRRRRRRRASSGGGRRRRRNPDGGGGSGFAPFRSYDWSDLVPYTLSSLAQAFVVRRWGDAWGQSMLSGQPLQNSGYRGNAWTLKNYLLGLGVAWAGSKLLARSGRRHAAAIWWRAGVETLSQRLLWTEVFSRWDWAHQNFGQLTQATALGAMPPAGSAAPGSIYDDGAGNRFLMAQNGQWVSMQGTLGELVHASSLGGPGGYEPLGHLLDPNTDDDRESTANQTWTGSRDPYAAALMVA